MRTVSRIEIPENERWKGNNPNIHGAHFAYHGVRGVHIEHIFWPDGNDKYSYILCPQRYIKEG